MRGTAYLDGQFAALDVEILQSCCQIYLAVITRETDLVTVKVPFTLSLGVQFDRPNAPTTVGAVAFAVDRPNVPPAVGPSTVTLPLAKDIFTPVEPY